ncbi:hypothetical protein ONZ45_g6368 [Pleurotus djamor]|nr:hypothetical protein ONZ45_g6368 [Pleurotus djamor]
MAKPADSELYDDIYGDDNEFLNVGLAEPSKQESDEDAAEDEPVSPVSLGNNSPTSPATRSPNLSLPAKPATAAAPKASSSTSTSPTLSYSAQIAKQFSSYQQTPGQERGAIRPSMKPTTSETATQEIPTTTSVSGDTVYGKKPSEMHDYGWYHILQYISIFYSLIPTLSSPSKEGLKNYFSQFGKVDACTIMRDPSGTSRGFAFLTFEDPSAVNTVISREHTLDGKMIDPKRAIPREEHLRNTRYFVGGLAPHTTSETMKAFFSTYGNVVDATVMMDRESGRSKGFGFVTFDEGGNADQLIEVKAAQPRSQREQRAGANGQAETPSNFGTTQGTSAMPMNMNFQQMPMMTNMNPMAMMNMGMNRFNGMGGMTGMTGMGGMGNMATGMSNMAGNLPNAGTGGMAAGMGNFNPMSGMGGMGGMNAMGNMGAGMGAGNMAANMNNVGAMRLGMGPMGATGSGAAVGGMGMGMNAGTGFAGGMQGMAGMGGMMAGGMGNAMAGGMGGAMTGGMASPMVSGMVNPMGGRMGMGMMNMGMNNMGVGRGMMNQGVGPARMMNRGRHSYHPYARG